MDRRLQRNTSVGIYGHGEIVVRLLDQLELRWIILLGLPFAIGGLFAVYGLSNLGKSVVVSAFAFWVCHSDPGLSQVTAAMFYSVSALYIGGLADLDKNIVGDRDYSYGLYIYAFPVQQIVAIYTYHSSDYFILYYISSLFIAIMFAVLSWHYVEKPALTWKGQSAAAGILARYRAGARR